MIERSPKESRDELVELKKVRKISPAKRRRYSSIYEKNDTKNGTNNDRNNGEKSNDNYKWRETTTRKTTCPGATNRRGLIQKAPLIISQSTTNGPLRKSSSTFALVGFVVRRSILTLYILMIAVLA
jgi:hypothetical protein